MRNTRVNSLYPVVNAGILSKIASYLDRNKLGAILVSNGYISPLDLKSALAEQRKTNKPLGSICLKKNYLTIYQLFNVLLRQKIMRLGISGVLFFASLGCIGKKVHAGSIKDVSARISIESPFNHQSIRKYPALFGAAETRSDNLKAFTKWSGMFERFDASLNKRSSNKIIQGLKIELAQYRSPSIHKMANQVNAMMNKKKYILDNKNWGKSDYWATPIEFLTRGGDCEDFAIAKYAALRALGVPEDRMRLAIVQDLKKNIPHAVLIVYTEHGPMVLDNQNKAMLSANSIKHYKPIYSINRTSWWLHTLPAKTPQNTIVASSK